MVPDNSDKTTNSKHQYVPVADFYKGKTIFITGGTGFLGKAIIEKLVYSCSDIKKIYVLTREKKDMTIIQRFEKLLQEPVFARLRNEKADVLKKIVPIQGDITLPDLGMKSEDEELLINEVSVVIHSAAIVKFNDILRNALLSNVEGTRKILELSKRMKAIEVFVYISTAYSHTDQKILEEKMYLNTIELSKAKNYAEEHYITGGSDEDMMKFIKDQPNTYTFTKALAETLVERNRGDLPTIIIRPSIITSSFREPTPGWVDNWSGATGIIVPINFGVNKVLRTKNNVVLDIIPVDYVSNLTLIAISRYNNCSWIDSTLCLFISCFSGLTVYHSCTSSINPLTMKKFVQLGQQYTYENGFGEISPKFVTIYLTKYKCVVDLITFILQTNPSHLADLWLKILGKRTKYVKFQKRALMVREALSYFTMNTWEMKCDQSRQLYESLSSEDQATFRCDPKDIDWKEYIFTYCKGIETFLLKRTALSK
ncbi:hypothetical protein K1T71_008988 [Dendrolimus kikuchii]|uniref:Uncharacterized protein n=1 Tax=Dendrolimus kikuchii TaxID=765133 RepID=A0ACC1CVT8_9NEOP|nr:hypothetical protein K1T71_008988 [Dendrolimus kikuchii]